MVNTYDNYYDAIDAEGVGATVNIGGKVVKAETADGYQGKGSSSNNNSNGIIGDLNAVGNSIKNTALNYAGSHGLKPAEYTVGADGKGISTGGLNDATLWDFPKLLLNSVINAEEAAELNPYWDNATNTYDKSRDVNGDGIPDYDSQGNTISKEDWDNKRYVLNKDSGDYDKTRPDGSIDNDNDNTATGTSDFDKVVADATAEALALADNKVKTTNESLTEISQADTAQKAAEEIVAGKGKLTDSSSVVEATKGITVDADAEGTTLDGADPKYALDTSGVNSSV